MTHAENEQVKKTLHPVALSIFVVAGLYFFFTVLADAAALLQNNYRGESQASIWLSVMIRGVGYPVVLVALGMIVELLDQISWNTTPPEERVARRSLSKFIRSLRPLKN